MHVPGGLLEAFQVLPVVVDEDVLVVAVVAVQQQAHRGGERQAAVRAVGREPLVAAVRRHLARQVFRVREGVQAEDFGGKEDVTPGSTGCPSAPSCRAARARGTSPRCPPTVPCR